MAALDEKQLDIRLEQFRDQLAQALEANLQRIVSSLIEEKVPDLVQQALDDRLSGQTAPSVRSDDGEFDSDDLTAQVERLVEFHLTALHKPLLEKFRQDGSAIREQSKAKVRKILDDGLSEIREEKEHNRQVLLEISAKVERAEELARVLPEPEPPKTMTAEQAFAYCQKNFSDTFRYRNFGTFAADAPRNRKKFGQMFGVSLARGQRAEDPREWVFERVNGEGS